MDKEATAIGIDVGKRKLDVALIIEGKVRSKSVVNSSACYQELAVWLTRENVELDRCLRLRALSSFVSQEKISKILP